jgi:1-acyl-sn-glycerol-3-phosphate acyltransferase
MVESSTNEKETKGKDKVVSKDLMKDLFYAVAKGISGFGLETFTDLKIKGKENVPIIGKAILTTVSDNAMRDLLIISQVSGRRIHFMVHHKLMKNQMYGPILKSLGMFRSTLDKDDTIPIDKVFHYLNEVGDLVAMTPESRLTPEVQIKAMAGIIKFAVAAMAPIIPIAIYTEKARILNMFKTSGIRVKIGTPLKVEKRLTREKYRNERYELAEDIIKIIDSLKVRQDTE